MTDATIVLKIPLAWRVYLTMFGFCWCSFLGFAFVASIRNRQAIPVVATLVLFLFGAVFTSAQVRARVRTDGDELRVRNFLTEECHHGAEQ